MLTKINVMFIIDDLCIGGAQNVLLNIIKAIDKAKHRIYVVSLFDGVGLANDMESAGAEVIFLQMAHKLDLLSFFKLIKLIRRHSISIVHTHLLLANILGRLAAKLAGTKVVVATLHNYFYRQKTLNIFIEKCMYQLSNKVIAVSEDLKQWFMKQLNINGDKLITIHNFINLNDFQYLKDGIKVRKELGIENGDTILGNIQPMRDKNEQKFLIYSISKIVGAFSDCKLLMVGDGPEKRNLENLVKKLGLNKHISFLGFRRDVPEIMSAIDIFVSCPQYESFGMVILEAMAMQKPVITTKAGGIPEVVSEYETAILVEPQNSDQLAKAIMNLLNDKEKRKQMGLKGRTRAEKHFSAEIAAKKYETLYKNLLIEAAQ